MAPQTRRWELDFIRAISIVAVVTIHVTAPLTLYYAFHPVTSTVEMALNQLTRFCVPAFLVVSGVLAYTSYQRRGWGRVLKSRFIDLGIPYMVWTAIGLVWARPSLSQAIQTIFIGITGKFYQLYYLVVLFQFIILLPVFVFLTRRFIYVALASLISIGAVVAYQRFLLNGGQSQLYDHLIQVGFASWIIYFAAGCYIGRHYERFMKFVSSSRTWILLIITAVTATVMMLDAYYSWQNTAGQQLWSNVFNFFRLSTVVYSLAAILLMFKLGTFIRSRFITHLYDNSFGIFLSHVAFLTLANSYWWNQIYAGLWSDLAAIAAILVVSYLFVSLVRFIPGLRLLLFGVRRARREHRGLAP